MSSQMQRLHLLIPFYIPFKKKRKEKQIQSHVTFNCPINAVELNYFNY